MYIGFNEKISFYLPVVLLVLPFVFGWILELCLCGRFCFEIFIFVLLFTPVNFSYCLGLLLKRITLALFCCSSAQGAGPSFGALTPGFSSLLPWIWAS
jgi:hypothetical protein